MTNKIVSQLSETKLKVACPAFGSAFCKWPRIKNQTIVFKRLLKIKYVQSPEKDRRYVVLSGLHESPMEVEKLCEAMNALCRRCQYMPRGPKERIR